MKGNLIFILFLLAGCSTLKSQNNHYQVIQEFDLGGELKETSGLYCSTKDMAYTVNDSGNQSVIYQINKQGHVVNRQNVAVSNVDWEAITGDMSHFFIGDIGNNSGKRESLYVHALAKNDVTQADFSMEFNYLANNLTNNQYRQHDFDAESLVIVEDELYLFSKSWKSNTLSIYQLDKTNQVNAKLELDAVKQLEGIPGVITGGDYDVNNQRFILVGYQLHSVGLLSSFVLILDRDFKLQKNFALPEFDQVEGLCVNPNGEVWITQEGSFFSKQKLVRLHIK